MKSIGARFSQSGTVNSMILLLAISVMISGLAVAIPGVISDANADHQRTPNLYVSSDRFGGPMILEIIVDDPDRDSADEIQGAPDVTFYGYDITMVQGDDGSWYAYVAHQQNVAAFNALGIPSLDFGESGGGGTPPVIILMQDLQTIVAQM